MFKINHEDEGRIHLFNDAGACKFNIWATFSYDPHADPLEEQCAVSRAEFVCNTLNEKLYDDERPQQQSQGLKDNACCVAHDCPLQQSYAPCKTP